MAAGDVSSNNSGTDETQLQEATTAAGSSYPTRQIEPEYVGAYRLIRKVGEGGMGQVWLAEQTAPVRRQVALKLIKGGWFDAEVIQRFESERQTLAMMDHPAIAKVFDAGSTPDGRPYFVMEYVAGMPITAYCDGHTMNTRRRLELFILVCEGVQHAHQKSIIHRDLKPSNILVNEIDGAPLPRIIDFGIAKATMQQGGDSQTVLTRMGALVGTPDYMSPEQSDPGVFDIDTRTDVYSLGVLLYEILTGCLPFAAVSGQKQRIDEVFRQLREVDPPSPSARLKKESATLTSSAVARGTTAKQLVSHLRGDLDQITMKALEKSRARRYATPSELAADVRRFLADEPIVARPPSAGYQMAKFTSRNRILVAGIAAVLLVLLAGATASTILAIRATRARTLAEQRRVQTEQARALAVQREKEATTARHLAEQRETEAEEARLSEARQRTAAELSAEHARKETLEAEKNFNLAREAVDNYFTKVSESKELKTQNLEKLRRELLVTARDFYQKFVSDQANNSLLKAGLGGAMLRLGRADMQIGDNVQSEQSLHHAGEILEAGMREHPDNPIIADDLFTTYAGLGLLYFNTSQFDKAEQSYEKAIRFMESWRKTHTIGSDELNALADLYDSFGSMLTRAGKMPGARDSYSDALAIRQALVKQSPDNDSYKNGLIMTDTNLAALLAGANQIGSALPFSQDSVAVGEAIRAQNPNDPEILNRLGVSYNNLGGLYTLLGRNDEAETAHRRSMELRQTLAAEHPAIVEYSIRVVSSYINLGELAERRNDPATALEWLKKAENVLKGVLATEPRQSMARYYLSYEYSWQARAYESQGNRKESLARWERAIEYDDHNDPTLRAGKALALAQLGDAPAATALADQLAAQNPRTDTLFDLAGVYAMSAAALSGKDAKLADADEAKSVALLNKVASAGYFRVPEQLEQLKTGHQFAAVRARDDYKLLMNALSSGK